jgi:hypothetical protein
MGQDPGPQLFSNGILGLAPGKGGESGEKEVSDFDFDFNKQVVKGDHQKADAAAVPDHLWVHFFLRGYALDLCAPTHLAALGLDIKASVGGLLNKHSPSRGIGWVHSLEIFRSLGLRWWRRNLVRGYTRWRRTHIKINKGCLPSQMVRPSLGYTVGRGEMMSYQWTTKGRAAYKAQWMFLRATSDGLATVKAGLDAIRQASQASWFKWLEGLAPFFWNWGEQYHHLIWDG